jgi:hypothetical protein
LLADELRQVQIDLQNNERPSKPSDGGRFQRELRQNRFLTSERYNSVIAKIRQQPGFETFMLPFSEHKDLRTFAGEGPVILFVHNSDCHVILIAERHLDFMHLPEFGEDKCHEQYQKMTNAIAESENNFAAGTKNLDEVLTWLWNAAAKPVLQRLGLVNSQKPATSHLPRVWWVTSGWINLLPIHAAGDHHLAVSGGEGCSVIDFVIPSYVPSLSVLAQARKTMDRMTAIVRTTRPTALLASMEVTPDVQPDLPNAPREVQELKRLLAPLFDIKEFIHPMPRRQNIVTHLRKCFNAHLATHGRADDANPLRSIIFLEDWKTHPLNVGFMMRMDFDQCQLIYLSGCDMAVNKDVLLKEEGLHIAGALQMAGVPNTIATWWKIRDLWAVQAAKGFYDGLMPGTGTSPLDVRKSAISLRNVMLSMRGQGLSSLVWAPFVHFGP